MAKVIAIATSVSNVHPTPIDLTVAIEVVPDYADTFTWFPDVVTVINPPLTGDSSLLNRAVLDKIKSHLSVSYSITVSDADILYQPFVRG